MGGTCQVLTVAGLGSRILSIRLFTLGEKNEGHVISALNICKFKNRQSSII